MMHGQGGRGREMKVSNVNGCSAMLEVMRTESAVNPHKKPSVIMQAISNLPQRWVENGQPVRGKLDSPVDADGDWGRHGCGGVRRVWYQ